MKQIYWALIVISLIIALLLGSDGGFSARAIADTPLQHPEATHVSANPAERSATLLSNVLLGHWVTDDGVTHAYFNRSKVILVNLLRAQGTQNPLPYTYNQAMPYNVTEMRELSNRLYLRVQTPSRWAQDRMLHFSADRQTFVESMDILGHFFSNRWTYVDAQQQP